MRHSAEYEYIYRHKVPHCHTYERGSERGKEVLMLRYFIRIPDIAAAESDATAVA